MNEKKEVPKPKDNTLLWSCGTVYLEEIDNCSLSPDYCKEHNIICFWQKGNGGDLYKCVRSIKYT